VFEGGLEGMVSIDLGIGCFEKLQALLQQWFDPYRGR
jgi:hypothetical protein